MNIHPETAKRSDAPPDTRIITPQSGREAFFHAFRSLKDDIKQSRALAWRIFVRDTSALYRQSLLGYIWVVLPPLATMAIWIFLNGQGLVRIDTGDTPYPLFVLLGTLLWTVFNTSTVSMQNIVGETRTILSKVNFPHESLVFAAMLKTFLNSLIPVLLLVPALFIYGVPLTPAFPLFILGLFVLMFLGASLGLVFVPIGALYSDVGRALQMALRFGFFFTPVVYQLPADGIARTLLLYNPISAPLVTARAAILSGETYMAATIATGIVSIALFFISLMLFKVAVPHVIERIGG